MACRFVFGAKSTESSTVELEDLGISVAIEAGCAHCLAIVVSSNCSLCNMDKHDADHYRVKMVYHVESRVQIYDRGLVDSPSQRTDMYKLPRNLGLSFLSTNPPVGDNYVEFHANL